MRRRSGGLPRCSQKMVETLPRLLVQPPRFHAAGAIAGRTQTRTGCPHRTCDPCASAEKRRRRRGVRSSVAAVSTAATAVVTEGPTTPLGGSIPSATTSPPAAPHPSRPGVAASPAAIAAATFSVAGGVRLATLAESLCSGSPPSSKRHPLASMFVTGDKFGSCGSPALPYSPDLAPVFFRTPVFSAAGASTTVGVPCLGSASVQLCPHAVPKTLAGDQTEPGGMAAVGSGGCHSVLRGPGHCAPVPDLPVSSGATLVAGDPPGHPEGCLVYRFKHPRRRRALTPAAQTGNAASFGGSVVPARE